MNASDWNPDKYQRYADLRLRPALDLLARLGTLPAGGICDLGCGAGAMGAALKRGFGPRELTGVDTSPAMLEQALATGAYDALIAEDAAIWQPRLPMALIFSNAVLHWLGDHHTLIPRLAGFLAPGGTLAVQMPHQNRAPSHRLWHDLAEQLFPGRFSADVTPGILEPTEYYHILDPIGRVSIWETEYFQLLPPSESGHPVRHFTSSTFARPLLAQLDKDEADQLGARYDKAMERAYPQTRDGSVLFPFRRLFFTLDML